MDRRHPPKPKKMKGVSFNQSQVRVAESASAHKSDHPIFCLRYLVNGYDLEKCDKEQAHFFVKKLANMAQLSWTALLLGDHKSGLGFEPLPKDQIKAPLPAIVTKDITSMQVIRFKRDYRIIGFRSDDTYRITHIELDRSAYDHG
ncbi:MAG: hypothetical protein JWS12_553 [Candidatus Saccharibacteria bacterium]|nr:hypothetical protein [Candidatus Saccharibacteria bacterium]